RVGDLEADSPALLGSAADRPGLALPRPVPPGRPWLDRRRVGHLARGPESQVLSSDRRWPEAARLRDGKLACLFARGQSRATRHLTSRGIHALAFPSSPPCAAR